MGELSKKQIVDTVCWLGNEANMAFGAYVHHLDRMAWPELNLK